MPLEFKTGLDIFDSGMQTLACPINVYSTLGKGLAKTFKTRCSKQFFTLYQDLCEADAFMTRALYSLDSGAGFQVLLFPTKYHWRQPSTLSQIQEGLRWLRLYSASLGIESLALPRLGCGEGGLAWSEVRVLIEAELQELPYPILVCE